MSPPGDALDQLQKADQRIAELEAELEALRGGQKALLLKLRKAETEVERLNVILRDIRKHIRICHDSSDSNLDSFYAWWGGGRESGGVSSVGETEGKDRNTSPSGSPVAETAAANPAVCTCAVIIGCGPCPVHGWSAARKERGDR